MKNPAKVLRYSVLAGAVYFLAIAAVHFMQIKIPGLYIYFDVPSTAYQDKIISLLAFGWSMAFLMASRMIDTGLVRPFGYMLIAGLVAVVSLAVVNSSEELVELEPLASVSVFWLEVGGLLVYLLVLALFYFQSINAKPDTD